MSGDHPHRSHYEVLGVTPAADDATLRRAYVALARQHHPDRAGGDAARMRALNEAWATLGDPVRRARYDRALALDDPGPAAAHTSADRSWVGPEADDLDLDDRPVRGAVRLPRWLSLLPAGLFATSVVAFVVGLVLSSEAVVALALMAFVLSCLFFLAAPFVALFASRGGAGGHWGRSEPRR